MYFGRPPRRVAALIALGSTSLLSGLVARPRVAHATDFEVSGTTAGQGYSVTSPWGQQIERRRILQTLGFSVYHLQGDFDPDQADYNVRVLFRVDGELGLGNHLSSDVSDGETNFGTAGGRYYVPGLTPARFDIMYAYVEGKGIGDGWFGFRAGRQYVSDALGWWSFDGGLVRLTTPAYFDVEAYGGLEQRGGLPLSTSRYESQGVWRGNHDDFDEPGGPLSSDYPSYQFAGVAPAFGVAVESDGPSWLHGRLTYRRVYELGEAFTQQFPDSGAGYRSVSGQRISSDKLGYSAFINKSDLGGLKGGFSYDFYNQTFPTAYGGIEAYLGDRVTAGLDADHFRPTFDGDSIFNWFTHSPTTTATGRVEARFTDQVSMSAQGGARLWETEGDPAAFAALECASDGLPEDCKDRGNLVDPSGRLISDEADRPATYTVDALAQLAARFRTTMGGVELRSMLQTGARGRRVGADVAGNLVLAGGLVDLGARTSFFDFGAPGDDTASFNYVLGVGLKPLDLSRFGVEWEHDINDVAGQRFRLMGRLDVLWVK